MAYSWRSIRADSVPSTLSLFDDIRPIIRDQYRVVDIGCGPGRIAFQLSKGGVKDVIGLDINAGLLAGVLASEAFGAGCRPAFVAGDARDLPFQRGTFDTAIMQALLTVIGSEAEREQCLVEAYRVLRRGGHLYLADFARTPRIDKYKRRYEAGGDTGTFPVFDERGKDLLYYAHHFCRQELDDLITRAGFEVYSICKKTGQFPTKSGNLIDGLVAVVRKPDA